MAIPTHVPRHVGDDLDAVHVHCRIARYLLIGADRLNIAAVSSAVQNHAADHRNHQEYQHRYRNGEQTAVVDRAVDVGEVVVERDGAALGEVGEIGA